MHVRDEVQPILDDLVAFRRDLHAHPELGFEEVRTAARVAEALEAEGIEVHRGVGKTGVVGVLRGSGGSNHRAIGLRADMDALPMEEETGLPYASTKPGTMHACGHDGHTTMLLGAARALARSRNFDGTVYFLFQPAEEGLGGADAMVKDGLFSRFPMEEVYGLHNMPGMPVGRVSMCPGPCMAAADLMRIVITGRGGHGAMPHVTIDPIVVASQVVLALQSIVSRTKDPLEQGVVSVTKMAAGSTYNVIPDSVEMLGTVRTYKPDVQDMVEAQIRRIVETVPQAFGATGELDYTRNYPATVNTSKELDFSADVARAVVGDENVITDAAPKMGAEDFSFMLNERPGSYIWFGNGLPGQKGGVMVHNTGYDFNDDLIPVGVSYWMELVERALPRAA